MALYDGANIFGRSVGVQMVPNPSAAVRSAFWGASGVYSSWGGGRGRVFQVRGVMFGTSGADLWANMNVLLSYDDGIARDLVDNAGNTWPQVVFRHAEPDAQYYYGHGGVCLPYRAELEGLV